MSKPFGPLGLAIIEAIKVLSVDGPVCAEDIAEAIRPDFPGITIKEGVTSFLSKQTQTGLLCRIKMRTKGRSLTWHYTLAQNSKAPAKKPAAAPTPAPAPANATFAFEPTPITQAKPTCRKQMTVNVPTEDGVVVMTIAQLHEVAAMAAALKAAA